MGCELVRSVVGRRGRAGQAEQLLRNAQAARTGAASVLLLLFGSSSSCQGEVVVRPSDRSAGGGDGVGGAEGPHATSVSVSGSHGSVGSSGAGTALVGSSGSWTSPPTADAGHDGSCDLTGLPQNEGIICCDGAPCRGQCVTGEQGSACECYGIQGGCSDDAVCCFFTKGCTATLLCEPP